MFNTPHDRLKTAVISAFEEFARGFSEAAMANLRIGTYSGLVERAGVQGHQGTLFTSGAHDPSTAILIGLKLHKELGLDEGRLHGIREMRNNVAHNKLSPVGGQYVHDKNSIEKCFDHMLDVLTKTRHSTSVSRLSELKTYYMRGAPDEWGNAAPVPTSTKPPVKRKPKRKKPPTPPAGQLSPDQVVARDRFQQWWKGTGRRFVICGQAGTGKTRLIPFLIDAVGLDAARIRMVTPTNKACQVLKEKFSTGDGFRSNVSTIHKLIWKYQPPTFNGEDHVFNVIGSKGRLSDVDLVFCDEASMLTVRDVETLESMYRVVFLGDDKQLPPVREGTSTDSHMGESDVLKKPDVVLTHVHRIEAAESLFDVASAVREGELPESGVWEDGHVRILSEKDGEIDRHKFESILRESDAVLVARNTTRIRLNARLRQIRGYSKNPLDIEPKPGERLVATESWREADISNGDRLVVERTVRRMERIKVSNSQPVDCLEVEVHREEDPLKRRFVIPISLEMLEGKHVIGDEVDTRGIGGPRSGILRCEWGYALTVHKAQGSEWRNVVVVDQDGRGGMDALRWNYVAMTRAKVQLTVVRAESPGVLV